MGAPAAAQSGLADQERRPRLNQRVPQACVEVAEQDSLGHLGRDFTDEERKRVLRRYPGDLLARREG